MERITLPDVLTLVVASPHSPNHAAVREGFDAIHPVWALAVEGVIFHHTQTPKRSKVFLPPQ